MGRGERWWESGNPRCEVVFPCSNRTFSKVGVAHVGGGCIGVYFFCRDECFNIVGHLIVHFVEEGPIAPGREPDVHLRDGPDEFFLEPVLDGYQPNGICIVDKKEGVDPQIFWYGHTIPESSSCTCQHHLNVAQEPSRLS